MLMMITPLLHYDTVQFNVLCQEKAAAFVQIFGKERTTFMNGDQDIFHVSRKS